MSDRGLKIILAGGGTGGHVIPAIAIADEAVDRGNEVGFVGTSDRIEARLVPGAGYPIDFVAARPLAGGGVDRKIKGLAHAPVSVIGSMKLLRRLAPNVVIGVGGYVAGPVVLGARLMGIPTALLEQNATVGLSNKILARLVRRAFVSYESAMQAFPAKRVELTGNPVKRSILEAAGKPRAPGRGKVRVLVMGGSQGALAIDSMIPQAMSVARLGGEAQVLHQCSKGRNGQVESEYERAGVTAEVVDFIDDTASAFLNTDLVVARAGATTVSELTVMGLPAVFLPYPHHADLQQEKNAAPMNDAGAAVIFKEKETTLRELADAIARFVRDSDYRERAAKASLALGRPDAARRVVDGLMKIARRDA